MDFVSRSLTYVDYQGEQRFITDAELAALPRSLIILGEPGMGKSRLLAELARADGTILRTAASFVNHPDPAELAAGGRTLIIDGLDEVSAVRDTDPINRVVAQLIRAKLPRFVLSCRVADWRGAVAREEISQEYAPAPMELLLQPLSPGAAESILAQRIAPDHAAEIVMELRRRDLEDLYGNPLTITLLAEVVASAGEIPRDRITLLQKACALMWRESNDRHQGSALSNMTEPEALDAAGAAFAALILSGRQAISTQPSLAHDPVVIPASEIRRLHDRLDVQAVIGSRLFSPLDLEAGRFRSVHRSVAEYLGARWIAQGLTTDIARDRFLEGITVDEGVPASLRGLHAWLPHFDDRFAARVIATDPYGVLRYGNADHLSLKNGRRLLAALRELQESNPFFRAEDWTRHSAAGLTQEPLREDLRNLLVADDTGFHLRTLLLEAIRGSTLAGELVDDLLAITLTADRSRYSFAERQDAAEVILALQSPTLDWASITFQLVALGDQDSTRLALLIHKRLGYAGIAPEQVAVTVLAQLGLLESVGADASRERAVHANLYVVERHLPDELIPAFLDELSRQLPHPRNDTGLEGRSELCDLVRKLVARTINHQPPDPLRLLAWLKLTAGHRGYTREAADSIQAYLTQHDSERRDIQRQALFFDRDGPHLFGRSWRMTELNQGLGLTNGDIAHFLRELGSESLPADEPESVWEELVTLARSRDGLPAEVEAAARPFTASRPPMVAKLAELALAPPRPDWEIENEEAAAEREREREDAWTKHRNEFAEGIDDVRAGELRWILPISQAYLGLFSDSDRALAPVKRIAQWLGPELAEAGLEGLEATLHRPDLPALEQVARDYAGSQRWNFVIPLIAAFNERVVSGRGIDDLPIDLVMLTAVALEHEIIDDRLDVPPLKAIIAARLRSEEGQYERYLRFLVEPSLTARREHIQGLYQLVRGRSDRDLVSRLPGEWLTAHPDLPLSVEDEFLDVLAVAGERDALRGLYRSHAGGPFHSDAHRWTWEAVGFLALDAELVGEIRIVHCYRPCDEDPALAWLVSSRLSSRLAGCKQSARRSASVRPRLSIHHFASVTVSSRALSRWPARCRDAIRSARILSAHCTCFIVPTSAVKACARGATSGFSLRRCSAPCLSARQHVVHIRLASRVTSRSASAANVR